LTRCRFLLEAEAEAAEAEAEVCIGGGSGRSGTSEAEVGAAKVVEAEAVEAKAAKVAEAEGCIGGGGMHWKHWNALEVHRSGWSWRSRGEYISVGGGQSGQNSFELDGTCLGLLMLHVGPNSDKFGGQAFMEHYTVSRLQSTRG
jgi:hypothetical protein